MVCQQLESAHAAGVTSCAIKLGGKDFSLDFGSMQQINSVTKYKRKVRRREVVLPSIWQVQLSSGWVGVPPEAQCKLQQAKAAGQKLLTLTQLDPSPACSIVHTYTVDLEKMTQTNHKSGTERKLRELQP